jgi:hypothetical protein
MSLALRLFPRALRVTARCTRPSSFSAASSSALLRRYFASASTTTSSSASAAPDTSSVPKVLRFKAPAAPYNSPPAPENESERRKRLIYR